uniref:Paired amphipathic helix protein Sin3a n=1 Tax=Lygus hesperus TaxID=30085 RepID=A0A0A9XXI3_LYGHE
MLVECVCTVHSTSVRRTHIPAHRCVGVYSTADCCRTDSASVPILPIMDRVARATVRSAGIPGGIHRDIGVERSELLLQLFGEDCVSLVTHPLQRRPTRGPFDGQFSQRIPTLCPDQVAEIVASSGILHRRIGVFVDGW